MKLFGFDNNHHLNATAKLLLVYVRYYRHVRTDHAEKALDMSDRGVRRYASELEAKGLVTRTKGQIHYLDHE